VRAQSCVLITARVAGRAAWGDVFHVAAEEAEP
jgi:hypothetical protein